MKEKRRITHEALFTSSPLKISGFTFMELMIVVTIIGLFSLGIGLGAGAFRESVEFNTYKNKITDLIQKARSYALVAGETEIFLVEIRENTVTLQSQNEEGQIENLESLELSNGFTLSPETLLYYFPPDGQLCFSETCLDTDPAQQSFFLSGREGTLEIEFKMDSFGGYPELIRTDDAEPLTQ